MYCKRCGKQIADDSIFCQYCGEKLDYIFIEQVRDTPLSDENVSKSADKIPEVVVSSKKSSSIQVESSERNKNISSTIANEIVENLKMIGIALCFFAVYMIGFMIYHSKDIKPLDENGYWGESCYDPQSMNSTEMFHWQQHFAMRVCAAQNDIKKLRKNKKRKKNNKSSSIFEDLIPHYSANISASELSLIMGMNAEEALNHANLNSKGISKESLEEFKEEAKRAAKRDRDSFNEKISSIRKRAYKEDLKKNATYVAIISLLIMILGRYMVKLIKWVNTNIDR